MCFKYCPNCGQKLIEREIGDEGTLPYCEKCEKPWWEMFSTSVICIVINEFDQVALLRQNYVSKDNHVCVAGFIKLGETAEETALREVKEEIGLNVQKLEYIKSSYYEKKQMLMIGYKAEVKKDDFIISKEVDSAEWVPMSNALSKLREGSIAWSLVKDVLIDRI